MRRKNSESRNAAPSASPGLLDRSSPLPLYAQIKRRLLAMILSWEHVDTRFHTEQYLSEQFGVSRMTVRQAMQELVDEGHLHRMQGLGTFVNFPKVAERFDSSMNFIEQWASHGRPLEMDVLYCKKEPCPLHLQARLGMATAEEIWHIVRLRRAKQVPISIDYRYIKAELVPHLDGRKLRTRSLLEILRAEVELSYGDFGIEAGAAQQEEAEYLGLVPGDPILTRHLAYYDISQRLVMAGVSHYRADQGRYTMRIPLGENSR